MFYFVPYSSAQLSKPLLVGLSVALLMAGCATAPKKNKDTQDWHPGVSLRNGVPNRYQVKAGDSISQIAYRYDLDWRQLSKINKLDDKHTIYIGQWLTLWEPNKVQKLPTSEAYASMQVVPEQVLPKPITPKQTATPATNRQSVINKTPSSQARTPQVLPVITPTTPPTAIQPPAVQTIRTPQPTPQNRPQVHQVQPTQPVRQAQTQPAPQPKPTVTMTMTALNNPNAAFVLPMERAILRRTFDEPGSEQAVWFSPPQNANVPVVAIQAGVVIKAGADATGGLAVMIHHDHDYASFYKNLQDLRVSEGQVVNVGDVVGISNKTLFKFHLSQKGRLIDPLPLMRGDLIVSPNSNNQTRQ